jgi:hypothetical protein
MLLAPITLDQLFFLYCALIYNNNETIQLPTPQLKVAENIREILEEQKFEKIEIPDHRYQYLLSLLSSKDNRLKDSIKPEHFPIVSYVQNLSKTEKLQSLLRDEKAQVEEHLSQYGDSFQKVTNLFKKTFSFESKYSTIYVTRNFGKSGMFIPLEEEGYLVLGNIFSKPNIRNLIHELLHAQLEEVSIKVTPNIKRIINELPDKVYDNYKRPYAVVEESLVRALVVYLTRKSSDFEEEELSEQDLGLIMPELYLKKLEKDNKDILSKDYLENLEI